MRISKNLLGSLCKRNGWCNSATEEQYAKLEALATGNLEGYSNPSAHDIALGIILMTESIKKEALDSIEKKLIVFDSDRRH